MELNKDILHLAHHRSRQRVRDLGEVFTPDKYVQQMLDMLDKAVWSDTNKVFFEPTCGHGNFVIAIVHRRLEVFLKQAKRKKIKKPHFYAVANTLNNLWAIDIDVENIVFCRNRVWEIVLKFLMDNENRKSSTPIFLGKNADFLAHILCCLNRQIHENELLSCLAENKEEAKKSASQTNTSKKWFEKNKHKPINFELPWCAYFLSLKRQNIVPIEYTKQIKFLLSISSKKPKGKDLDSYSLSNINFSEKIRKKAI